MQLVEIRENAVTVDLDWVDVKLLTFVIAHALHHDVGSSTNDPDLTVGYIDTVAAFLAAAGMASWATTTDKEGYTLEQFAEVVAITPEENRRWAARREAVQRAAGILPAAKEAPPAA